MSDPNQTVDDIRFFDIQNGTEHDGVASAVNSQVHVWLLNSDDAPWSVLTSRQARVLAARLLRAADAAERK